jgi:hypothetical protein
VILGVGAFLLREVTLQYSRTHFSDEGLRRRRGSKAALFDNRATALGPSNNKRTRYLCDYHRFVEFAWGEAKRGLR